MFDASGKPSDIARYVDGYRLFKRGEPWAICSEALAEKLLAMRRLPTVGKIQLGRKLSECLSPK
jgi:hypothetical protein